MATQIKDDWRAVLEGYVTPEAIATLGEFWVTLAGGGGIQLEVHRDGLDFELDIGPEGRIESVFVGRARP